MVVLLKLLLTCGAPVEQPAVHVPTLRAAKSERKGESGGTASFGRAEKEPQKKKMGKMKMEKSLLEKSLFVFFGSLLLLTFSSPLTTHHVNQRCIHLPSNWRPVRR